MILLMEEILHQLSLEGYPIIYRGFVDLRWCRISSINSMPRVNQHLFDNRIIILMPQQFEFWVKVL